MRKKINSSNLDEAEYDPQTSELIVKFKTGKSYKYFDVPVKTYVEFEKNFDGLNGKSAGKFFNGHIRHLRFEPLED